MKRVAIPLVLTLVLALWPASVPAASIEEAEALFARGDFLTAAQEGRSVDSAASLALAARATLAHAEFHARPAFRRRAVLAAEALAREALSKDARHVEALIQLSVATGYLARHNGALASHIQGLAADGRAYLEQALAQQPDNAWANAALGGWHIEVFRAGGSMLASAWYDASAEQGIALFRKSLEIDPQNAVLRYEFALALLSLDPDVHADEAEEHLTTVIGQRTKTMLETLARGRARRLLAALRSDGRSRLADEIGRIGSIRSLASGTARQEIRGK